MRNEIIDLKLKLFMLTFILSFYRDMWFILPLLQRHSIKILLQINVKCGTEEFNSKNKNENKSVWKKK